MRNEFARLVVEAVKGHSNDKISFLTGDLGFSVLEPIRELLGPRFINAGVAESLMTSVGAALSADGFKVFVYSITPFATFRPLEQIRNDICYHNSDVTVVGVGAGFGYGTLGGTHHSTEDLAALWSLPNMQIFSPADLVELRQCFKHAWSISGPKYFRIGKGGEGELSSMSDSAHMQKKVWEYSPGQDLTIIVTGNVLSEALQAVQEFKPSSKTIQILSCPYLKPFPSGDLIQAISSERVLVIEELNPYGGFSGMVAKALIGNTRRPIKQFLVSSAKDEFAKIVGSSAFQRKGSGLDSKSIAELIKEILL